MNAPAKPKTAISPTREENYAEWYQQVVAAADLAENSPVRGCMVIKPWGYALWENMQRALDDMFKATGHQNAYFPLFIPLSFSRRKPRTSKASPRSARSSRTIASKRVRTASCVPAGELEEPLIVRPTSETIIGDAFAQLGAELSRPAAAHQSVVQRRALGDAHAPVPAHDRVPLAGRPHRARDLARKRATRRCACSTSTRRSPRTGWRCR